MRLYFQLAGLFSLGIIIFGGCKPKTPLPTATIKSAVANNVVTFSLSTTNSSAYKWSFGDGDTSIVYSSDPVTHAYPKDGTNYSVNLMILGPGGAATATTTVTIPVMTAMDKLTGGSAFVNGKAWRISSVYGMASATPDSNLTIVTNYPANYLTNIQLSQAYTDQYIFFSNGNYTINSLGGGALSGFEYCTVNNIVNVQPQPADSIGFTYATPYTPPANLTFGLNIGKNLTIAATSDGLTSTNVTYKNVNTLSFSANGFVGFQDFMSECVVQQMDPTLMTIAIFRSNLPPLSLEAGKINTVLIVTLEIVP